MERNNTTRRILLIMAGVFFVFMLCWAVLIDYQIGRLAAQIDTIEETMQRIENTGENGDK